MKSDLDLKEQKIILGLFLIPGFGVKKISKLWEIYRDWEKIWNLSYRELKENHFSEKLSSIFVKTRQQIDLNKNWEQYRNYHILNYFSEDYPYFLKESYNPPLILFAQGNLELLAKKNLLSVVGSRKFTNYGKTVVEKLIKNLAQQNIVIVSGLAMGIDSLAHREALDTIGSTIAVLGSPINQIIPRCNFNLAQKIIKQGLIISEFPLHAEIRKENFPQRNKTIASLSPATLIIEASSKSGALITARYALEEGREVLTVPGSIFGTNSAGSHLLIKQGAKLVDSLEDVLEIYQLQQNKEIPTLNFKSSQQEKIYKILKKSPLNIDKIVKFSKLNTNVVIATITEMELEGLVKNIGCQTYQTK